MAQLALRARRLRIERVGVVDDGHVGQHGQHGHDGAAWLIALHAACGAVGSESGVTLELMGWERLHGDAPPAGFIALDPAVRALEDLAAISPSNLLPQVIVEVRFAPGPCGEPVPGETIAAFNRRAPGRTLRRPLDPFAGPGGGAGRAPAHLELRVSDHALANVAVLERANRA
ncbi:MAG: hypothetical protein ACKVWR_08860 [Acidimicrobiales bacterium]